MRSEEIVKIPLDEILKNLGYEIDRAKTSRRAIVMENNGDKIIISRALSGDYLYFNPHDDADRGNFFSFCKNRGIQWKEVILNFQNKIPQFVHGLKPQDALSERKNRQEKIKLFDETFEPIKKDNEVLKKRCLNFDELDFKDLKQDHNGNLCVKLWELHKTIKNLIVPTGYSAKLKNSIIKDKEGNPLSKPIKNLIYGDKGIEILLGSFESLKNAKTIIISESIIDSLSYRELKSINSKECIVLGTGGNMKSEEYKLLKNFGERFNNSTFCLCFDNDQKGRKITEEVYTLLSQVVQSEKIRICIPQLKDFNDDLQVIKNLNLDKNEQEIRKKVEDKIKNCEKKIKHSLLSNFEKLKLSKKCNLLKEKIGAEKNENKVQRQTCIRR